MLSCHLLCSEIKWLYYCGKESDCSCYYIRQHVSAPWYRSTDWMYIKPKLPRLFPHVAERFHGRRGRSGVRKCLFPHLPNGSTGTTFPSESSVLPVPAMALSPSVRAWSACRMASSAPPYDCRKLWRTSLAWGNNKEQRPIRQQRCSVLLWKLLFSKPTDWIL